MLLFSEFILLTQLIPKASAASDVFRSTTYELQSGEFTGLTYTLSLNNNLSEDYFVMISGPSSATASRAANEDQVRVTSDPYSNFGSSTSADEIELTRGSSTNDWIGALTVIECLLDCTAQGFELKEVLETSLATGITGVLQSTNDTLASNYTTNTVPFGGRFGGGISTGSSSANNYATTVSFKPTKVSSNQIQFDRFGGETRVPDSATVTTYIVEWGSSWTVQDVNVTGTASGSGLDATNEYDTASVTASNRDNSWVWGGGFTRDDGLGDGALGQAITLGDGVAQNSSESVVAVGSEGGLIAPGRDFQVYVMEMSSISVDYRFRSSGDAGPATGFQELDMTVDSAVGSESYDNSATDVQYTEGYRVPLFYNTSSGTGQAYSRTGAWGLRIDADANLNYWRAYAGQNVTGWMQSIDFGGVAFSNVDTRQQSYRWRDDSTDLNTSGGWLAAENTSVSAQPKNTDLRLRLRVANHGTTPEDSARTYELQFANKSGNCSASTGWTGISDSSDDFELYDSGNISPDGELTSPGLLSNGDGFSFVSGEGREVADTTGSIGPMSDEAYTELEYALRPTDDAVTGRTYCFRLYDTASATTLDTYTEYPELTIESTSLSSTGLGEAGTFSSAVDGGWTTVNFLGNYTTPVVVGTTNSHNGQSALVFESRNVTSTSADMRVCESEGSTTNGCDTHASETVGYMVIDASIAATTDGIEAGTFTASGEADTNSVTTNYSESFTSAPYVFANVNTVNSSEVPIEVVIPSTSSASFSAGICDHSQTNQDSCDGTHGNETVGWVAIEPGNEPFSEQFDSGTQSIASSTWTAVSFSPTFSSAPVVIVASQTDTGGQDVEIDEARSVTTTGADIRYCEIDTLDVCDSHNPDTVAWFAIESGEFTNTVYADQDGFRFYENLNNITPTIALGAENADISNVDDGDILRIRMAIQAGEQQISADSIDLKLQYKSGTTCDGAGTWNDVGGLGSGTIWRGYNNATPADGATLPSSLLDGSSNNLQTYEEANNASPNPNVIDIGERGEWDWVIENNNADDFTSYCFRAVTTSNETLNYTRYPKLTTSTGVTNLAPNSPTNLDQKKVSNDSITVGQVINETTVVFTADVSDQNTNDIIQLCVEAKRVGVAFTNSEDSCGSTVVYTGTALEATVQISSFENNRDYHWQVRVKDSGGLYSSWVSFGGNTEAEADFSVDTVIPVINVFDGDTTGVDIEYNQGELDELSANWEQVDGSAPDEVNNLVLWLDGDDVDGNGTDPSDGSSITTWTDKSGQSNDIGGTGDATFNDSLQAVAFSDDVQPFDDNYDRSGGDSNSQTIFAVVTGNASTSNHVWYETTTPRIAPAEDGLLGAGTSLTNNNSWSSHITDKSMFTLEYLSTGTSTAWLNTVQEYQFSETQNFADTQRLVIGDDTTGGNRLESGEYIHEIALYNDDLTTQERQDIWEYLQCKWELNDCSVTYEYSMGTSPGGTDIQNWTSVAGTSVTASSLTLETSQVYFVNIRATDIAGNQAVYSSDGQQVAPTITFSATAGGVNFDTINDSNGFTDTETTTLTTSTNARQGYEIRSYATGLLTNSFSDTISMFNGGTYALPDAWLSGDTGYGYTSSDTLVQGVNKFNPATCAGGGSGPCYVPFSLVAPGDIVADNTSTVSGSPIVNEQFTITHRVTTEDSQEPGNYTTVLTFSASAKY